MYKFFKNIAEKSSCSFIGACTIHPSISAMYDILLIEIREISFYIVKMKEFGFTNKFIMAQTIEALSLFLINTSINKTKYLNLINNLNNLKNEIKEKYISYCKSQELPCEIINTNLEINQNTTINELIKIAEINSINKQKITDKTKQRLFELITIFAKLSAINVVKIKKIDSSIDEYDYEILRFFALTNGYSIRNEKIKRRIIEFAQFSLKLKQKFYNLLEMKYGKKQNAKISTDEYKGHSILVSGDDIVELDEVLKTIEEINSDKIINVYTNGALFLAHFYPYFQNNKYLKGHWGTEDAQYDFSKFQGAILITKNFIQKIDSLYKGEIYSNKTISFSKVIDIKNNDYKPLIQCALSQNGFLETKKQNTYDITYDDDKINELINNLKNEEIIIIAGDMENKKIYEKYENKKIIHFNCPLETDLMLEAINKLQEKNNKSTIFFPQCNLESLYSALILLSYEIDIYISNCSNILINPHVFEALNENFNVKTI